MKTLKSKRQMAKMDVKGLFFPIILTMGLCVTRLPSSTAMMSICQDSGSEEASSYSQQSQAESTPKLGEVRPNFLVSSLLNSKYLNYSSCNVRASPQAFS